MSLQTLVDGWNARDGDRVASAFTADGTRIEFAMPGARVSGHDAIAQRVEMFCAAIPDCALDVRGRITVGDVAVLEWTFVGTHVNDLPGLPATGLEISVPGVSVCALRFGLITEERVYWDTVRLVGENPA